MPQPIRVIHTVPAGPDQLRAHVITLTSALARHRCEPVVVGHLERPFREELARNSVRWVNLPLPVTLKWREQKDVVARLARLLHTASPALIHAHGFQAALTSSLALRYLSPRPPLVCTPHGIPDLQGHRRADRTLRHIGYRRVLKRCDAVIVGSETERDLLARLNGARAKPGTDRISVIPPGIEPQATSSVFDIGHKRRSVGLHQDAAIVVLAASLEPDVPFQDFLHAAALLGKDVANVEFAIIGEGSRTEQLKALAHELGLSGSTVFLGPRPDAADIIATCNVFAVISDNAWAGAQALHALAKDLRVVANDLPGLRELFADVESIPVAPISDHRAFADAMRDQLEEITVEEDEIHANTGMAWSVSEVLASQDEFDLDKPGLDPRDRSRVEGSDVQRLLAAHSVQHMLQRIIKLYSRLIDGD